MSKVDLRGEIEVHLSIWNVGLMVMGMRIRGCIGIRGPLGLQFSAY